ncbi:hypothetical protein GCM10009556_058620 [Acrocarpospora pleiomorpha]
MSRATASRVMNNMPGASGVTRARVAAVAASLGYRPNEAARALASGRRMVVDLVVIVYDPDLSWLGAHPYYSRVIAGMMAALDGSGVHLRIHAGSLAGAAELLDTVARQATVGAVLVNVPPELAVRFQRRCPRVVSLSATAASVPAVEAENAAGAYTAVSHLHRVGRGRIAAIHGPEVNTCANPPLSTMRLPAEEMAAAATEALLNSTLTPSWRRIFPVELITRRSTDPAAYGMANI